MKRYAVISTGIGVILALILGEIVLRAYKFKKYSTDTLRIAQGSRLVFEHKPSIAFVNRHGIKISYNSLGFIGEEVKSRAIGSLRILGVGDSITAGEYLPEGERYLNRVAAMLSEGTKRNVEVVNAGVAGYNSWQELELIRTKGLLVEPDLIIVGVCLNDDCGWRPEFKKSWFGRMVEVPLHHKKARYLNFIYQKSRLYEFLYDSLYKAKGLLKRWRYFKEDYDEYGVDGYQPNFDVWKEPLKEMISLAKGRNIKLLFVIFPFQYQVEKGEEASFVPLIDFFKKENVWFVDLIGPLTQKARQEALYLKRDPIHLNAEGTRIAAESIANYIVEKGIMVTTGDKGE